jgi:hypothetical protein
MTEFATVTPEIQRDRYGRPLITPPGGGKPVAMTRCTTYIDVIEDKYNLQKWMQRMVALGLGSRPDLLLSVNAHREDKRALDRLCDDAREAAGASAAATTGTALHSLTELIDRGDPLPAGLPANMLASLEAYRAATAGLTTTHIEQMCVQDSLKVAGTPDRIGERIRDLKTGSIEWGYVKIAAQLAMYARSKVYNVATGERTEHGADLTVGTVIHLPVVDNPADAVCTLYDVDLTLGWQAVLVARQVREQRALKFKDVFHPAGEFAPPADDRTDRTLNQILAGAPLDLPAQIRACATAEEVRAMWTPEWTPELNGIAKQHIESLPAAS